MLELFLEQEKAKEIEEFLTTIPSTDCSITEFSLYSLGVILVKRNLADKLLQFVNDTLTGNAMRVLRLQSNEMIDIIQFTRAFNLDFDDAYQYTIAENFNLEIVSFDTDFDKTERGRSTPKQVLDRLKKQK